MVNCKPERSFLLGCPNEESAERHGPVPEPRQSWSFELVSEKSTTKIIFGTEWPQNTNGQISSGFGYDSYRTRLFRWFDLHLGGKEIFFYSSNSGISQNIICFVRDLFNMFQCELWIKPYKNWFETQNKLILVDNFTKRWLHWCWW